jgi:two-component system, probable response regulator PhcQ
LDEVLPRVRTQSAEKTIQVENSIPTTLPKIQADRGKLARFFELLLKDEVLNLNNGGKVVFTAIEEKTAEEIPILKLTIKDNGAGLAAESIRCVFDPFFVRSDSPSEFGLNLMACFFIIYHHGGKIDVQSEPGAGTTFSVTLPLNPGGRSLVQNDREFLPQMLSNETLWEKLLAGTI